MSEWTPSVEDFGKGGPPLGALSRWLLVQPLGVPVKVPSDIAPKPRTPIASYGRVIHRKIQSLRGPDGSLWVLLSEREVQS